MPISTIAKTEAITLRVAPFSNTSHIVTWLTPTHGKIATIIKGACRPKSLVLGQYDIGYLCELLFYERDRNGLYILKECSPLDARHPCRGNWQITAAISYLCHLAAIATPDGAHAPELYNLLKDGLNVISNTSYDLPSLLMWFELQVLNLLGLPPQLHRCISCTQHIATADKAFFSTLRGGILCRQCNTSSINALALPADALAILRRWQSKPRIQHLHNSTCNAQQHFIIHPILVSFMTQHLDLAPECSHIAHKMIKTNLSTNNT